jgi:hypothetical protein
MRAGFVGGADVFFNPNKRKAVVSAPARLSPTHRSFSGGGLSFVGMLADGAIKPGDT